MPYSHTGRALVLAFLLACFGFLQPAAAATVIKVAVVTPEGSPWTEALYRLADSVGERTGGEVTFTIYAGGISGDEEDVLRKMQADRIQAAGFSGVGLGILVPEIRILEAPLLYRSHAEVYLVKTSLTDRFSAAFEKKGFILLGFAEAGFVYFFSTKPMNGPSGFSGLKMWVWKGDPVAQTSLKILGIQTFPLQLSDVNTGLETGMINAFYSPPAAAIAYQWHSRVRYLFDYPMVNSTGAILIKARTFDRLTPEQQTILREASQTFCDELVQITRRVNSEAREALLASGIQFEKPSDAQLQSLESLAPEIYQASIGTLYSRELYETVQSLLQSRRRQ
jgi:TRAP-type C4-dicarboxylate transport system substrate-binding protein